jgi:hypothetical protein
MCCVARLQRGADGVVVWIAARGGGNRKLPQSFTF